MNRQLIDEATAFFDEFVDAFRTFDGSIVAELFTHPYLAQGSDGSSTVLCSHTETAAYFQEYLDSYKSIGCKSCKYNSLEAVRVGKKNAFVTVTWTLLDADNREVSMWRESYNVVRSNDKMLAYGSVDHDE